MVGLLDRWMLTSDTELCGSIANWDEFVYLSVVINNHTHYMGAERNVFAADGQRRWWTITHLPVPSYKKKERRKSYKSDICLILVGQKMLMNFTLNSTSENSAGCKVYFIVLILTCYHLYIVTLQGLVWWTQHTNNGKMENLQDKGLWENMTNWYAGNRKRMLKYLNLSIERTAGFPHKHIRWFLVSLIFKWRAIRKNGILLVNGFQRVDRLTLMTLSSLKD